MSADSFPARVRVQIEVSKGGHIKRSSSGHVDYISPLPCPFNYGSIPGSEAEDGEPEDAVVLGGPLPAGHSGDYAVVAWVDFLDAGVKDPKFICAQGKVSEEELRAVARFFRRYARIKAPLNRLRGKRGKTRFRGITVLAEK